MTTSIVAVVTDFIRDGRPVIGFGFSSIGRFAQSGLIRERFAPRLLAAKPETLCNSHGRLDPVRAWGHMLTGEKPGGHGERCVAIGTLDMALWDAAAKADNCPLHALLRSEFPRGPGSVSLPPSNNVAIYASGGYRYPEDDLVRLGEELQLFIDQGHTQAKIKIGGRPIAEEITRIETALNILGDGALAVDCMCEFDSAGSLEVAEVLGRYSLLWLEDVCDPHDFETLSKLGSCYEGALAAGEAVFSAPEAKLLNKHGGLRPHRDRLLFDPVHCYGVPGFVSIMDHLIANHLPGSAFWPHGGHLFNLHIVAAFGLGGAEANPIAFQPFSAMPSASTVTDGRIALPHAPGIGFETVLPLHEVFERLLEIRSA